uniref:Uncharacterized protein n=1 Tax=Oryza sativa subsp. japonica TaxID=39947 RepID=Q6ESC9_ORYSJ|nr:hypothetical protein [Oryza sativa Japonica Group]
MGALSILKDNKLGLEVVEYGTLQVLYVTTNVILGQLYGTSNLNFHKIWDVKILEKYWLLPERALLPT